MDKNFIRQEVVADSEADWYDVRDLTLYGITRDVYLTHRMPEKIAEQVNDGVHNYSIYGAGGRVRFTTDSSFVALKVEYGPGSIPTVNNHCVSYGFDLYREENGEEVFAAAARPVAGFDRKLGEYKMVTRNKGQKVAYTLNFPVFTSVKSLLIGVEKGTSLTPGRPYRNENPVVYYGSSITHGAAAGRPGNTYESFISQQYNLDYVNLGFSGSARGEQVMARYIAGLPMSVFVCDYDHNAPSLEHLQNTHYAFYETIREKRPDLPYIMVSRPTSRMNLDVGMPRRQVILENYQRARAAGDMKVFFVDGATLFDGPFAASCTSDGIHPNDLGFFRMSQKIGVAVMEAYRLTEDYKKELL